MNINDWKALLIESSKKESTPSLVTPENKKVEKKEEDANEGRDDPEGGDIGDKGKDIPAAAIYGYYINTSRYSLQEKV